MSEETDELFDQFREIVRDFDSSIYEEPKKLFKMLY